MPFNSVVGGGYSAGTAAPSGGPSMAFPGAVGHGNEGTGSPTQANAPFGGASDTGAMAPTSVPGPPGSFAINMPPEADHGTSDPVHTTFLLPPVGTQGPTGTGYGFAGALGPSGNGASPDTFVTSMPPEVTPVTQGAVHATGLLPPVGTHGETNVGGTSQKFANVSGLAASGGIMVSGGTVALQHPVPAAVVHTASSAIGVLGAVHDAFASPSKANTANVATAVANLGSSALSLASTATGGGAVAQNMSFASHVIAAVAGFSAIGTAHAATTPTGQVAQGVSGLMAVAAGTLGAAGTMTGNPALLGLAPMLYQLSAGTQMIAQTANHVAPGAQGGLHGQAAPGGAGSPMTAAHTSV